MPISVNQFERGSNAVDRKQVILEACVEATNYMLRKENAGPVEVIYGKGWATHHRWQRKNGIIKHTIKYGAECFERGPELSKYIYVVSSGRVIQVIAKQHPESLYILSVIIEETAHYFQTINGDRGSMHGYSFLKEFLRMWQLYSDDVMEMVEAAIVADEQQHDPYVQEAAKATSKPN